jgi:hypothetical protein
VTARRTSRLAVWSAAAVAASVSVVVSLVVSAGPALAIGERGDPGGRLTWEQTTLIFLGIPVAVAAIIAFLVYLPTIISGPRYRPGRPWSAGSSWFGGPPDPEVALAAVTSLPAATVEGGGASARW